MWSTIPFWFSSTAHCPTPSDSNFEREWRWSITNFIPISDLGPDKKKTRCDERSMNELENSLWPQEGKQFLTTINRDSNSSNLSPPQWHFFQHGAPIASFPKFEFITFLKFLGVHFSLKRLHVHNEAKTYKQLKLIRCAKASNLNKFIECLTKFIHKCVCLPIVLVYSHLTLRIEPFGSKDEVGTWGLVRVRVPMYVFVRQNNDSGQVG